MHAAALSALLLALAASPSAAAPALTSAVDALAARAEPDWASIRCPPAGDVSTTLPTPSYGSAGAVFSSCGQEVIDAPASAVYAAIIGFKDYHVWNTFVRNVTARDGADLADVEVGLRMTFYNAGLAPGGILVPSLERVSRLDPPSSSNPSAAPSLSCWIFDLPKLASPLIKAEHNNILTRLENGSTLYVSYETYYAPVSVAVDLVERQNLQTQFQNQGRDLKKYVESMQ